MYITPIGQSCTLLYIYVSCVQHELQQLRQQLVKSSEAIQQLKDHVSSLEQARQQLIDQLRMKV